MGPVTSSSGQGDEYLRQIAIVDPQEWERLEAWYRSRGQHLFLIPGYDEGDGIPTYAIGIGVRPTGELRGKVQP